MHSFLLKKYTNFVFYIINLFGSFIVRTQHVRNKKTKKSFYKVTCQILNCISGRNKLQL